MSGAGLKETSSGWQATAGPRIMAGMAGCCCDDYDAVFGARAAHRQLTAYRRDGAKGSTRRLVTAVSEGGVEGRSVLDIGGGIGIVGLELLAAGADRVTEVEAARAYATIAQHEVARRGLDERVTVHHGDFVALAPTIQPADIVTLDRVVCCYADWPALVDASTAHALQRYGLVYPNDRWWLRAGIWLGNLMLRLMRRAFRGHVHPERKIDARIRAAGFRRRSHHRGRLWQTAVYERVEQMPGLATSGSAGA